MSDDLGQEEHRALATGDSTPLPNTRLSGQQLAFYRAIAERDVAMADWYFGAVASFANTSNPERLVHAAHSMRRELMEKLHTILPTPVKAKPPKKLGDVFATMSRNWEKAKRLSGCFDEAGGWRGDIDTHARRGFAAVDDAIETNRKNRPGHAAVVRTTLRALDSSGRPLPEWIEDPFVTLWSELYDHFSGWRHHGGSPTDEDFLAALEQFEKLVLDRLKPRTFADMATIDALIEEAER